MILDNWRFLSSTKLNKVVQTLASELERNQKLLFWNRIAKVNADDDEIMGRYKGTVFAGDLIAEGQEAIVHEGGTVETYTHTIPKIKLGTRINEPTISKLERIKNGQIRSNDIGMIDDWQNQMAYDLILGVQQRINALCCAMMIDDGTYNRLGIKLSGGSWGMPALLKVTSATFWTDAANSTPISDLQTILSETAPDNYGEEYNRITLSRLAFRRLVASAEFLAKYRGEFRFSFASTSEVNIKDEGSMRQALSNILGVEIEVYDETYKVRENNGNVTTQKVLPQNKVLFSNTSDDNNRAAFDWANGVVTESLVADVLGVSGFGGASYGPIAYYTGNPDMNPPDIVAWSVARGFPRKHRPEATAVLTVW